MPFDTLSVTPLPASRTEARERGERTFFTGKPCVHGHISERATCDNRCCECARIYRANNVDKTNAYSAAHYAANKGYYTEKNNLWRAENIEKVRELDVLAKRIIRAENPEVNRDAVRSWRIRFPEKSREGARAYRENNPEKARASDHNKRARRASAEGSHTAADITALFSAQKGRCAYCRTSIKAGYHVDHIIALARGGSNFPKNLQLLCAPCNQRKSAKDPLAFAQELGFLV